MAKKDSLPPGVREREGRYTFRYSIPDPATGDRIQKETPSFNSAKEAYDKGIRIRAMLLEGRYVDEKDITVSDWADQWLKMYEASGRVKNKTVDVRRGSLKMVKKRLGGTKLKEVTPLQYQTLLDDLKKEEYSRSTIDLVHVVCKMVYKKAVQFGIVAADVTIDAELPVFRQTVEQLESEDDLPEYLEKEELARLLRVAKEHGDRQGYHILFTLAYTGLRIGELCALKTSDIDEVNRRVSITKTLYDRKASVDYVLNPPKTPSSVRKVDIGEAVARILKAQDAWRKEYRMSVADRYYSKEEFVFVNNRTLPGYPEQLQRVEKYMKEILDLAKLPSSLTPHSLRHTYTSLMAEAGVELPAIQRLLGHVNDDITRRVYLHVTKAKKREAVDKLDALMDGLL